MSVYKVYVMTEQQLRGLRRWPWEVWRTDFLPTNEHCYALQVCGKSRKELEGLLNQWAYSPYWVNRLNAFVVPVSATSCDVAGRDIVTRMGSVWPHGWVSNDTYGSHGA